MPHGYDNDRRFQFNSMKQVHGFVSWAFGVLLGVAILIGLSVVFPNSPFVFNVVFSAGMGIAFMVFQGKRFARKSRADMERNEVEYRNMIEAEKQKKIDEMRRANSNIPEVERKPVTGSWRDK
ncbi:MAG: cytosine/uracil/thiamine/allantoin permease [Paracoccaceae bacterium]|jgi:cytosine/uracil/thiamine/allantoin permease